MVKNNFKSRKSMRLKNYDYSKNGLYFITICTQNREFLFGEIENGKMIYNEAGKMVNEIWSNLSNFYSGFVFHEFILMPNHIHGIIEIIGKNAGTDLCVCPDETTDFSVCRKEKLDVSGCTGKIEMNNKCKNKIINNDENILKNDEHRIKNEDEHGLKNKGEHGIKIKGEHGLIKNKGEHGDSPLTDKNIQLSIGDLIMRFKSYTTKKYSDMVKNAILPPFNNKIWQRNYHDNIIRSESDYLRIAIYIRNNPVAWNQDKFYKY